MRIHRCGESEEGMALISVMLMLMILMMLVTVTITVAVHSNDVTGNDKHKENAFAAASAGIDDAVHCLKTLSPTLPLTNCNINAGAATQLSDAGTNTGQYSVSVTDLTPSQTTKQALIQAVGWGPTSTSVSAVRSIRHISATYNLIPNGGFFDTIFAGGASPAGLIDFKNSANINGTVYARSYSEEKNGLTVGDLVVVGDVVTKNNSIEHSITSGGSITMGNNGLVQTYAKACGANGSPGNASLGNNAVVTGNMQYAGTLSLGVNASVGSSTKANCPAPAALNLPTFSYSFANYPGWTVASFTTVTAVDACLATAGSPQAMQTTVCGMPLGDLDGTIGKNANGTLVYANIATCSGPVMLGTATFTGNFTIVTNCPLSVGGVFSKSASATGNKQAAFITTSNTGANDLITSVTSADPTLSVLLYASGQIATTNNVSIAAGSAYGSSVVGNNSFSITASNDLAKNPPPGFTFDPSTSTNWIPSLSLWQEG